MMLARTAYPVSTDELPVYLQQYLLRQLPVRVFVQLIEG